MEINFEGGSVSSAKAKAQQWVGTEAPVAGLKLVDAVCCLCEEQDSAQIATGEDFEYRTSEDSFGVSECRRCGLVFLNPRPDITEFNRIYPSNYHAFEFSQEEFGLVYRVRRRLEANRLLSWCKSLDDNARILDVGCGDGFHLKLLRDFGNKSWKLEGIDLDERAVAIGRKKGLKLHLGSIENSDLSTNSFDLVILIQTLEHVAEPLKLVKQIRDLLRPGGRLIIVTDNTGSLDFSIFKKRHWGGYHFPRHWSLFNRSTLRKLATVSDLDVEKLTTQVSPVNWTYSVRNLLVDHSAPNWLVNLFSLRSTASLTFFTAFDMIHRLFGRGALLNAVLRRPDARTQTSKLPV
ncbi:MAG: class I SAM-dependent methyltransferase [Pyrinomonadaceae bacterium]|nr:class I SAM-dependent methyltransferase [Pyrinomonadaceae bacterium]